MTKLKRLEEIEILLKNDSQTVSLKRWREESLWLITELREAWKSESAVALMKHCEEMGALRDEGEKMRAEIEEYREMLECTNCKKIVKREAENRFCDSRCKDEFWNEQKSLARFAERERAK